MRRKTRKQQPKPSTDSLLKTSKKGDIELTEQELGKVSGGLHKEGTIYSRKASKGSEPAFE